MLHSFILSLYLSLFLSLFFIHMDMSAKEGGRTYSKSPCLDGVSCKVECPSSNILINSYFRLKGHHRWREVMTRLKSVLIEEGVSQVDAWFWAWLEFRGQSGHDCSVSTSCVGGGVICYFAIVKQLPTLRASLSGTFLQTLARTGYATKGALFIFAHLSTDAVSALRKVWVLITLWMQRSVQAHT